MKRNRSEINKRDGHSTPELLLFVTQFKNNKKLQIKKNK